MISLALSWTAEISKHKSRGQEKTVPAGLGTDPGAGQEFECGVQVGLRYMTAEGSSEAKQSALAHV